MEEKNDEILCLYCGESNDINNSTCKKCGNQLHLKDNDGNVIDVSSKFVNDVEQILNIIPEYRKKLLYIPKNNKRFYTLEELFLQGNNRSIYEDIWLFYRIYEKNRDLKYENIKEKKYQSLDELVVFYATVLSKILLDKRTKNNSNLCNKKNYEIVAYILGFSEWIDRVNKVKDNVEYDNYNSSLSENEILYLKSRINTNINKIDNNEKKKEKAKNNKRPSIITMIILIIVIVAAGTGLYFNIFNFDIEKCKESVVLITTYDKYGTMLGTGSGFCAFKDDRIVTNYHVIEGAYKIVVTTNSKKNYEAKSVEIFRKSDDLAIISIDGSLKPLKVTSPNSCRVGDEIITIGSPKGELNIVSKGTISSLDNQMYIAITAPISHGSSGGVLINKRGKVIGITSSGYEDAQNLNYAISAKVLIQLEQHLYKAIFLDENSYQNSYEHNGSIYDEMLEFENIDDMNYYRSAKMLGFYRSTSGFSKFDDTLATCTGNLVSEYNSKSVNEKYAVYDNFVDLRGYDNYKNLDSSVNNISNWTIYDWILNLRLMDRWKLALFIEDYSNLNGRNAFDVTRKYTGGGKLLILWIKLGLLDKNYLNKEYAEKIAEHLNSLPLTKEKKVIILTNILYN